MTPVRVGLVYDAVYPFTLGGVEHRNHELARRLAPAHPVRVYGFDYWAKEPHRRLAGCEYVSVGAARPVHGPDGKRRTKDALAAMLGTLRALLVSRDDVWDVANIPYFPVFAAWLAARLRGRRLVVTWHEFWGDHWAEYLGRRRGMLAKWVERLALACTDAAIAVSPLTRDRLRRAGFPANRLRYVPNGTDVAAIAAVPPHPGPGAEFVYAGRLTPHKRVDLAIRALAVVRRERPGATLWVIGDGPDRGRLEALAADLGLADAVRFWGFLPADADVFARIKACRVAVLPSAREGFGLAAVQAWACGRPVVVCDDPDNATAGLVTDPRLGRVVPAAAEAIAGAAAELLAADGDADWRAAHAREHYDLDRMAAAVLAVYREAAGRRGRG